MDIETLCHVYGLLMDGEDAFALDYIRETIAFAAGKGNQIALDLLDDYPLEEEEEEEEEE